MHDRQDHSVNPQPIIPDLLFVWNRCRDQCAESAGSYQQSDRDNDDQGDHSDYDSDPQKSPQYRACFAEAWHNQREH
jgi:hypothetical protein